MRPITVSVGPNAVTFPAHSEWVRFDDWAPGKVAIQCTVSGTVSYTVETTLDDPNSPTNPVAAGSMTWLSSLDTNVVAATASKSSYFDYAPVYARVTLASGSGSVTATFLQHGNVTY